MAWNSQALDDGPVPLWHQLATRLRHAVEAGEFAEGDALPSESTLNRQFGVSRTTARAALDHLENEGLIVRGSGRGSIVLPPKVSQPLNVLASFTEDMQARGLRPTSRTAAIRVVRANVEVATALEVVRSTPVVMIQRLLCADERPIAFAVSWLAPGVLRNRKRPRAEDLDGGSLYEWLERECGARIAIGTEFIEAEVADRELADRVGIPPGHPLIVIRRTSRTAAGTVVEYVVTRYRADRYRLQVELVRP